MHMKMVASCGLLLSKECQNFTSISTVKGACLGHLDNEGASLFVPSRRALYYSSLIFHCNLWRMCHVLIAAA